MDEIDEAVYEKSKILAKSQFNYIIIYPTFSVRFSDQ